MSDAEETKAAVRHMRGHMPLQVEKLTKYIERIQSDADTILRSATEERLLRQNQGKAQLCEELLEILKT